MTQVRSALILCSLLLATMSHTNPITVRYRGFQVELEPLGRRAYDVISVDIGRRASVDAGNRASIRMLSRLIYRYPNTRAWDVSWSTRFRGKVVQTHTQYIRWERSLQRGYIDGVKTVDGGEPWADVLDGTDEEDIHAVARKSGTLIDVWQRVIDREARERKESRSAHPTR